jgi:adenylate cyclase, class 2
MKKLLVEIKAKCADHIPIRAELKALDARFVGLDHQVDTYFKVPENRLKLREGTIENNLIYYNRPNQAGPKRSDVLLHPANETSSLKAILETVHGILVVVDKQREIWFVDNVKVHLDEVHGLGRFVEIEAIGAPDTHTVGELQQQCENLMHRFAVKESDLLTSSYSDMLVAQQG